MIQEAHHPVDWLAQARRRALGHRLQVDSRGAWSVDSDPMSMWRLGRPSWMSGRSSKQWPLGLLELSSRLPSFGCRTPYPTLRYCWVTYISGKRHIRPGKTDKPVDGVIMLTSSRWSDHATLIMTGKTIGRQTTTKHATNV
jgi:hypothetical protein